MVGTKSFARSLQLDAYSCGPHSVAMALRHFGIEASVDALRREMRTTPRSLLGHWPKHAGTKFAEMQKALRRRGLNARWQRTTLPLLRLRLTQGNLVLAHVDGDHVLVVHGMDPTHVHIADPSLARAFWRRYTHAEFARRLGPYGLVVRDR